MSRLAETKELARVIREHTRGGVQVYAQSLRKAKVVTVDPELSVQLTRNEMIVDEDHLLLGTWARFFDLVFHIDVGDTLLMVRLDDGDWFVVDVISKQDLTAGVDLDPDDYKSHAVSTENGNVIGTIPYNNPDGSQRGVMLVWDEGSLHDAPPD